ncbi:MAG: hypothetical protein QXX64_02730 [Nitrososphaera sp.]
MSSSGYSEDDIRRAADIREWLIKQIEDKQEEVERLRTTLAIIDNLLKQGSFKAAASIGFATAAGGGGPTATTAQVQQTRQSPSSPRQQAAAPTLKSSDNRDIRPLKRAKDDFWLANAEVSPNAVVLVPAPNVNLNVNTPPFRSFFLNRILDGMKNKDASQGIKEPNALNYKVDEDNGEIKRIVINNYRDKDRLQEIFNTSTWVFTRMLEKSGGK